MEFETIRYDVLDAGEHGIASVTLDRPETRNAQNKRMTYELNAAFDDASRRRDVKVIVLWVADVIVAAEDALFSDPVVGMGVNGVEYFAHPWELGARKAKELLFTGDWVTAEEACRLGMVNHVVAAAELRTFTLDLACRIAQRPSFALKLAKESVNQALEAQGQLTALKAAFSMQHLAHAHNRVRFGVAIDPGSAPGPSPAPERAP
jgi:enoyl-CoA hydratase/carnithine racemase